jgi:hypothetical protein
LQSIADVDVGVDVGGEWLFVSELARDWGLSLLDCALVLSII